VRPLLERTGELEAIRSLLGRCVAGEGAVLIVEGPPGIGKTVLLESARASAPDAGVRVLSARGGELEREFAHAVVRELFERPLAAGLLVIRAAAGRPRIAGIALTE
jgi:hypothetical protein